MAPADAAHPLVQLLTGAAAGSPPPADGALEVLPPVRPGEAAILGFTAHNVLVADLDPAWVRRQPGAGDLSERFCPPFLSALERKLGRRVNAIDAVLAAPPSAADLDLQLTEITERDHPRVRRALRYRSEVRVWRCDGGVVVLGRGLAGRIETAAEVDAAVRNRGLGRALFAAARRLAVTYALDSGLAPQPVWAQVSPANVASVRALNAAGYLPVGAEAMLVDDR